MSLATRTPGVLAFAHLGDLHLTRATERNFADLLAIVAEIEIEAADRLDFVVLPGDNADNGRPDQYRLATTALRILSPPVHAIPGDHDMEGGSLDAFYAAFSSERLPKMVAAGRTRCLFLDISGAGTGGPDFRLGRAQLAWVERQLEAAEAAGDTPVVFMHSYPADLQGDGEASALDALFNRYNVALVDIGHTHYNEIANTGRTVYAATRSTGQVEEGPVGYAIVTLDEGVVGWRFKLRFESFPFVVITTPADHRLARAPNQAVPAGSRAEVHALVLGSEKVETVHCRFDDGAWQPMRQGSAGPLWIGQIAAPDTPNPTLTVRAVTADGRPGQQTIRVASHLDPVHHPLPGSDAAAIGAWPENGILGTQLGPNRNGRAS